MKLHTKILSATIALSASSVAHAASGYIDLFSEPAGVTTVSDTTVGATADNATNFVESGPFASILGSYRDLKADMLSNSLLDNTTSMSVGNGFLSFNNGSGVKGTGIVQWDGQDNSSSLSTTTDLGNIYNLGNAFVFDVLAADLGFNFSIGLYDTSGRFTIYNLASNAGAHSTQIAFSLFDNAQSNGLCGTGNFNTPSGYVNSVTCNGDVDLTHLSAIEAIFNVDGGTTDVDLTIGAIKTVPEPSTVALLGLGLVGASFSRRKTI
ncbi:PEP-CTERM sorting domain-containing protein [Methylomonas sp. HW2-6]|uniref:PEP-CTERM sorting domain-containing protein n=1 Tax=Methylomonas sp. HW2-6 TaxID=3376687 RepID=UPI0040426E62